MALVASIPALDTTSFSPGASHQQPSIPLGTATIVAGPDRIRDLVRPVTLDGIVGNRDPATGLVMLQTALGALTLDTAASLPHGAMVTAQLTPGVPPSVTLFAQPAVPPPTPQSAAQTPAVLVAEPHAAAASLQAGQVVTAIPVPSPSQPGSAAAGQTAAGAFLPVDVETQLALLQFGAAPVASRPKPPATQRPAAGDPPRSLPQLEAMPGFEPESASERGASAAPAAGLPHDEPQAAPFAVRIVAILPSDVPPADGETGTIRGTVAGFTLSGQPIVDTGLGKLVLRTDGAVPAGTQLLLERVGPDIARGMALSPLDILSGKNWPALAASLTALASSQPALAEQVALAVPQVGPLLGPALLLFIAGLRTGAVRGWLGDRPLEELRRAGHGDVARMLESDFEAAAQQSFAPLGDGWHAIPVPLLYLGELGRLQLYLRRSPPAGDDGGDPSDRGRASVRFVIEAEPGAVGPIQLDGLVARAQAPGRPAKLDLILRSRLPLSQALRSGVAQLFSQSLATSGLTGGIIFQGAGNWLSIGGGRAPHRQVMA